MKTTKQIIEKTVNRIVMLHYVEITDAMQTNGLEFSQDRYLTNEGGKQYLVEVWR